MDYLSHINRSRSLYASARTWFLSSDIRPSGGFASSRRVLLYGLFQASLSRQRVRFMVTTEAEAIEALARCRPGMLLITPNLEESDWLQLIERARSVVDDIRTIVLCDLYHDDLIAAGHSSADAVICEQEVSSEAQPLKSLVITLSLGRRYRSPAVEAALRADQAEVDKGWRDGAPALTNREQELIDLWVEGLGDRQAAERLGVSYATARSYGHAVRRKLGAASRAQVLLKVMQLGLARVAGR